jgi:hypothetical protein
MFLETLAEFCGELVDLRDEGCVIPLLVLSVFVLWQAAAEFGIELRGVGHLGCREKGAGGKVLLLVTG